MDTYRLGGLAGVPRARKTLPAGSREAREPQRRLCGISDFTQASEEKGPLCEDPRANTP